MARFFLQILTFYLHISIIFCTYAVDFVRTQANKVQELVQVTYDFSNPSTKLFNREVGGLTKASKITHCDNLTLIVMYGETGTIEHNGKKIRVVSASEWLVNQ